MSRICGYLASGTSRPDLGRMLTNSYSVRRPPGPFPPGHAAGVLGLAAEQDAQLARRDDGRYVCAVDGRVFESPRLREAWKARGTEAGPVSPAALVLDVYLVHGVDGLRLLEGGFVFAILDTRENTLVVGRDLFGVKTLFYSATPSGFLFSSSLTALASAPWFDRSIGLAGFLEYLACGYVSAPWTIYEHASALKPGECITVKRGEVASRHFHTLEPATWAFGDTGGLSDRQLADRLDGLLLEAVRRRLPAGPAAAVYLSGGLDTSLLCAALKEVGGKNVVAYTLGFNGRRHDETPYARAVARHLGVEHQVFDLDRDESFDMLSRLPDVYGQPLADISAIPTCIVANKVSQRFDAVFDGQGPDFLFGNFDLRVLYYAYHGVPRPLRRTLSRASRFVTQHFLKRWTSPNLDVAELLRQPSFFWTFTRMFKSHDLERLVGEPIYPESFWACRFVQSRTDIPLAERLRLAQFLCYGISDVLFKAAGAHAASLVDILCPYFDLDVFNFVQFLPTRYKFRRLYGKYLQKKLLFRKIPRHILERPKRGFIMDFVEFGADTTRALTNRYLSRKRLSETGLFDVDFALQCVEDYYRGDTNMGPKLWTLLLFELWRERFSIGRVAG